MSLNYKLAILVAVLLMFGCEQRKPENKALASVRTYTIIKVDQPKHYSVDIQDDLSGQVFLGVGRRKHCDKWENNPVGTKLSLSRYSWWEGSRKSEDFDDSEIARHLCD